jgi:hypothetical protein
LNTHPKIAVGHELKITPHLAQCWTRVNQYRQHLNKYFFLQASDINSLFRELMMGFLDNYRDQTGKYIIGEKTPNNVFWFQHLGHIFPKSAFIHVIRDGRDVVSSLLQRDWYTGSGQPVGITRDPVKAIKYWKEAVQAGMAACDAAHMRERCLEVHYEELVFETEETMKRVLSHLGVQWDPKILHFHRYKPKDEEVAKIENEIFSSSRHPISANSIGRWKDDLSEKQKEAIYSISSPLLDRLGYL